MRGLALKLMGRLWPLFRKELRQLQRNRRLVVVLVIPPTLNIVLFGLALNPTVSNLSLGVVDASRSASSRELTSAFTESQSFKVTGYYSSVEELGAALTAGKVNAGLVIPVDFDKEQLRQETSDVQLLIDAVDSNTAAIAAGYAGRIINSFNQRLVRRRVAVRMTAPPQNAGSAATATSPDTSSPASGTEAITVAGPTMGPTTITPRITLLYNPGLRSSWFIATGLIGTLLVLQGTLVSAASMVKEKEVGTVEQLLMTPAESSEIIIAKTAPILLLLTGDIALALIVVRLVFGVPVRGSLALLFFAGSLCVLSGIGIGTLIATFTRSQQQAQLMGFFVNPPIALLSGATFPIEAMPAWLQPVTLVNPVRHFATIARGIMLKGTGLQVLYPNVLALMLFAAVLVSVSAWQFRKQLG
jgi:drug efflux transport system permease protein